MAYRLIVFDLDGTLLDTIEDLGNAVEHALAAKGLPGHEKSAYAGMVGHGIRNLVKNALPASMRDNDVLTDECLDIFKSYYSEHIADCTRPYQGIPELLAGLDAAGVRMAVASNKFQEGTEHLIRHFFPEIGFVSILGNSPALPLKPDPAIVLGIMDKVGITDPSEAVMVGDSGTDIATGHNAGVKSVAVSWGFRPRASLQEAGADIIADTVGELSQILGLQHLNA